MKYLENWHTYRLGIMENTCNTFLRCILKLPTGDLTDFISLFYMSLEANIVI